MVVERTIQYIPMDTQAEWVPLARYPYAEDYLTLIPFSKVLGSFTLAL